MNPPVRSRILLLSLIAATQIFSPVFFVPGVEGLGASVFRVVLILICAGLVLVVGFDRLTRPVRRALVAGTLLMAWMTISLIWTNDVRSGFRQISYVATTLLLLYSIDLLATSREAFQAFAKTIAGAGAGVLVFSLYELWTGNHLFPSSLQEAVNFDPRLSYILQDQAWFTFGNPNDLAVHLVFCCFVLTLCLHRTVLGLASGFFFWVGASYMADKLDARIALMALLVFGATYLAARYSKQARTGIIIAGGAFAGAILVLAILLWLGDAFYLDLSTFIRLQLVRSGFAMVADSALLGVGVGGFETEMAFGGYAHSTYGFINPHSALTRMLAENGIIGLALFAFLLCGPLIYVREVGQSTNITAFVAATTASLPLLYSAGSDPLASSSLQLALAMVWVASGFALGKRVAVKLPVSTGYQDRRIAARHHPLYDRP